jgi:hypothetical protein
MTRRLFGNISADIMTVFSLIRDADSILLLGPGEAKVELRKRIENEDLCGRIVGIETVGRMTDRQIAAKVRQHYSDWD